MPQAYTYPGIYIEIASGVRTIAGVSTSDTAFIDFFKQGPVDDPVRITSFGDFERIFGGLDAVALLATLSSSITSTAAISPTSCVLLSATGRA